MIQLQNPLLRFHKTTKGNFSGEDFQISPMVSFLDDSDSLAQIMPYCLLISVHRTYQSSYQKNMPQIHIHLLWIWEKLVIGMNRPHSTTPNHFLQCRLRAQGLDVGPLIGQVPLPMDLGLRHQSSHILMTITTANSTSQHLPDLWKRWTLWNDDYSMEHITQLTFQTFSLVQKLLANFWWQNSQWGLIWQGWKYYSASR